MVEFKVEELPEAVRSKPLKLGSCPHGVTIVTGTEVFVEYPQLHWRFRKETGHNSNKSLEDLDASAKVSLFWGLVGGHINYSKHKLANRGKTAKTTSVTLRIQTGVRHLVNVKSVEEARCSAGVCRDHLFYVSTVCVGGEASMSMCVDTAEDSEASFEELGGGLSLFGMGRDKESGESATKTKGHLQMHACYTSSLEDPVEIASSSTQEVTQFMKDLRDLEQKILVFPEKLVHMGSSDKLNSKYIFEPVVQVSRNAIVDDIQLKLDAQSRCESILEELLRVKKECELLQGNRRVDDLAIKTGVIIRQLENLKRASIIEMDKVMNIYGEHAVNFYIRELRRLTK